jgi:AcrR family transcriptional regulator
MCNTVVVVGRPPKFTEDQILDTASRLVACQGPAATSVAAIAAELGAPTGSIYHRFASRDLLMGKLWIRVVRDAQAGFIHSLEQRGPSSTLDAALHLPRWSREHLHEAQVAAMYRREDLAGEWPDELGADLDTLNHGLRQALRRHTKYLFGYVRRSDVERVTFALIDVPHAATRRHLLAAERPPRNIDRLVAEVVTCLLPARSRTAPS